MSQILAPFQLLELNVISAQDLASLGRNMRTYAVAWVHPDRKLSTRVDTQGHTNPTWNDKFVFRVDEEFLYSDTSAIMVEVYALHWFKDIHVGTVRVLVGNLIPPPTRPFHNDRAPMGMRFVALQVRRPSGRPQGILNIGVTVLDSSMRSMPLYTLNASAVGYRHLMGEKDAYDSHNHLSPHVIAAGGGGKPELRRTKSDTSSLIASEAVLRQQRAEIYKERANSAISGSEISEYKVTKNKKKKKRKKTSKASSIISSVSGSVLSDEIVPWKVKNGKTSYAPSDAHVEPPPPPRFDDEEQHNNNNENVFAHQHVIDNNNVNYNDDNRKDISYVNTVSEAATTDTDINQKQKIAYDVKATPKRHYPKSPAVAPAQFKNSPKPQFKNSPKLQYKNSPMPEYKNSPKPKFIRSPTMPEHKNSPKPQFKNSPMPEYKNSPMPEYKNSPMHQVRNSPMPQFRNSPMPEYKNSPMHQVRNSPMPQFRNSPMPQFRNSPAVLPQFRNSPAVSKFNPAVGFGGSHRGTPMHPFGKMNGAMEYATPMRSNLANMRPVIMTESELGPSPSEVAAAMARKPIIDEENSTVGGWSLDESVEGLQSKLERWRTELPPVIDHGELSSFPTTSSKTSRHSRRHTEGGSGNGLFSCFSNICGVECSVVCGGDSKAKAKAMAKKKNRHRTSSTEDSSSLL
ncbi:putative C2 domain-containing protein [Medicago truncatula]|uniref:Calcium-dependent lipid-binding (CaLB domain) family protein n=1 Tax=Medicago truncatula TaxID=3880 RepID=G7I2P8_MEDTR|nr:uncharacterized protein LOC11424437 [Medicago truncatula]AES60986.1 calcium-dependent lipid-binding (CaLB domain) family protein [Medicago truncatula]RHN80239.1 putative C2 domain-containing protein [Medicago truncatula]